MRLICVISAVIAFASPSFADLEKRGLLYNRTGLPLTLPLHVRTGPGQAYFLGLTNPETGETGMAAFFEGGPLFRVLAPPGIWRLTILSGALDDWQGAETGFGGAGQVVFDKEVEFRIKGLRTRSGVLVNLLGKSL